MKHNPGKHAGHTGLLNFPLLAQLEKLPTFQQRHGRTGLGRVAGFSGSLQGGHTCNGGNRCTGCCRGQSRSDVAFQRFSTSFRKLGELYQRVPMSHPRLMYVGSVCKTPLLHLTLLNLLPPQEYLKGYYTRSNND